MFFKCSVILFRCFPVVYYVSLFLQEYFEVHCTLFCRLSLLSFFASYFYSGAETADLQVILFWFIYSPWSFHSEKQAC